MSCVCIKETTISLRSGPNREHRRHELRDLLLSQRVVLDTARSWKSALLRGSPDHTRLPVRSDSLGVRLPPRAHGLALLFDVRVWHLSLCLCVSLVARKKEEGSVITQCLHYWGMRGVELWKAYMRPKKLLRNVSKHLQMLPDCSTKQPNYANKVWGSQSFYPNGWSTFDLQTE